MIPQKYPQKRLSGFVKLIFGDIRPFSRNYVIRFILGILQTKEKFHPTKFL